MIVQLLKLLNRPFDFYRAVQKLQQNTYGKTISQEEKYKEISYCDICNKETMQTFYYANHERDSSNNYQECHECKHRKYGCSNTWI